MSKRLLGSYMVWVFFVAASCGKPPVCTPGESRTCACTDGRSGAQTCRVDGTGMESCVCAPAPSSTVARPAQPAVPSAPTQVAAPVPAAAPATLPPNGQVDPLGNDAGPAGGKCAGGEHLIATVGGVIEAYEARNGVYPGTLESLTTGTNAKLRPQDIVDGCGRLLSYKVRDDGFQLCAIGPDGVMGTADDACYGGL
jgi:hypothetical protein